MTAARLGRRQTQNEEIASLKAEVATLKAKIARLRGARNGEKSTNPGHG